MIYTPFVWLPLFSAALLAGIAIYAGQFPGVRANGPFRILMWLCACFDLIFALSLPVVWPPFRFFLAQLLYLPGAFIAPLILRLAVEYTGHARWLTPWRRGLLLIIPVLTVVLALSYPLHTLFRYDFQLDYVGPVEIVITARGPWYWVYYGYGSVLTLSACAILIASLRDHTLRAWNTLMIIFGIVIPVLGDILTVRRMTPIPGYSWTPLLFVCTGGLYGWALFRGHLFTVRPMAGDSLMEHLDDPVIVLDTSGRVADFNRAAQVVCGLTPFVMGKTLAALTPPWARTLGRYDAIPALKAEELVVGLGEQQRVYDLSILALYDRRQRAVGRMLILHDVSARKRAELALRESEARLRLIVDVSPVPLVLTRMSDNTYLYVNVPAAALVGLTQAQAIGQKATDFYADPSVRKAIIAELRQMGMVQNCEVLLKRSDGSTFWALFSSALTNFASEPVILSSITDISERKALELILRQSEQRYRMLAENMQDVIWTLDAESLHFTYVSPSVERLRGYTAEEVMARPVYDALTPEVQAQMIQLIQSRAARFLAYPRQKTYRDEVEQPCKDGSQVWTEVVTSYYLVEATGKVEIYGVTRDISERKRAQDALFQANQQLRAQLEANQQLQVRLYEQAVHDALTGLFNRRYLEEALERLLVRAAHDHTPLSILMLDVDHFKQFNDSYGHKAGDLILRALGQLLRTYTRPNDVACRYGGEEFIVIMPDAPLEVAVVRADELRQFFADLAVHYGGTSLSATITIGVATFPSHGTDSDTLLHAADQALYAAKAAGRDLVYAAGE